MPIYAYRCAECGHSKDVLRKLSDPPLVICPACGAAAFNKQLTAAGFQLKGSGWYVTDFRDGAKKGADAKPADKTADKPAEAGKSGAAAADGGKSDAGKSDGGSGNGGSGGGSGDGGGSSSAAAACGGSCACH